MATFARWEKCGHPKYFSHRHGRNKPRCSICRATLERRKWPERYARIKLKRSQLTQ